MVYVSEIVRSLNEHQFIHAIVVDDSRLSRELAKNAL